MTSLVTYKGFANFTAALVSAGLAIYLQWGVGSGQTQSSNALNSTIGTTEARTAGTPTQQTTSQTNDTYQVVGTITALGTPAITEVGVFDAAGTGSPPTGGNMDFYGSFAVITLAVGDSITFTLKNKFS